MHVKESLWKLNSAHSYKAPNKHITHSAKISCSNISLQKMSTSFLILHAFVFMQFLKAADTLRAERYPRCDVHLLQFALNIEYLQAEFFLFGALGHGLDAVAPELTGGGSPPIGAEKANLQVFVRDIVIQLAFQHVGHIRAIRKLVGGYSRPIMDLSAPHFAQLMDNAVGIPLEPSFNPYTNELNFLIASYFFPYIAVTGYIGANSLLTGNSTKRLLAGVMAVEAGQDAIIRMLLYEKALRPLSPYEYTVAEITERLSAYRDQLGHIASKKDEGVVTVSPEKNGGLTLGNIGNADENYVTYSRTPWEVLRIVYGSGSANKAGGFLPVGANGTIAQFYLMGANANSTICGIPPSRDFL